MAAAALAVSGWLLTAASGGQLSVTSGGPTGCVEFRAPLQGGTPPLLQSVNGSLALQPGHQQHPSVAAMTNVISPKG